MKIGYIELQLDKGSSNKIIKWINKLDSSLFFCTKIDSDFIKGKVRSGLHLTLFFGINTNRTPKKEITEKLKEIKIKKLLVKRINTFPFKKNCKILHLEIEDKNKKILNLRSKFFIFPHFKDKYTHHFSPHVTLGYIKSNVKLTKIKYTGPKTLNIKAVKYKIYSK